MYLINVQWVWDDMPTDMIRHQEDFSEVLKIANKIAETRQQDVRSIDIFKISSAYNDKYKLIASVRSIL
jgi:hypothetical protein